MHPTRPDVATVARRHGLSPAAGEVLYDALVAGGGGQAQFSHPDLGGMGQWSGGMTQIGDMFNDGLKARIGTFCGDMAEVIRGLRPGISTDRAQPAGLMAPGGGTTSPWAVRSESWWPAGFGPPAASGTQNRMAYACFPDRRRLAILRDGSVTVYDTGDHRVTGFAQQQSTDARLTFSGPDGPVALDDLPVVTS